MKKNKKRVYFKRLKKSKKGLTEIGKNNEIDKEFTREIDEN